MKLNSYEKATWFSALLLILVWLHLFYTQLSNYHVLWVSCALAIPINHYRINYQLFARGALIASGCIPNSIAKRWLWRGTVLRVSNSFISVAISYLVIISVTMLEGSDWIVLGSSAALLIILDAYWIEFSKGKNGDRFIFSAT